MFIHRVQIKDMGNIAPSFAAKFKIVSWNAEVFGSANAKFDELVDQ